MRELYEYPGYLICEDGRVFSKKRNKFLSQTMRGDYKKVSIYVGGKIKNLSIHRFVAIAFIPNPENKPCVNHIDGDKFNNRLDNLEWCTHSENEKHAYASGLKEKSREVSREMCRKLGSEMTGELHPFSKKVIDTESGKVFSCIREAAEENGIKHNTLSQYLNGDRTNKTTLKFLK